VVLVDTSVWVRALAGKQPYRDNLDKLLATESVLGHEFVYGELLIGDAGARAKTLASYALFMQAPTVAHAEVVSLVRARRLYGRGIGWVDVHLLASSMVTRSALYTADGPLQELAESLGVAYAQ
jgi:predicted nucleic acid-binding protein